MRLKTQNNTNKGITLIALVITIIVLLILAGITITTITDNDSAITKAAEAKKLTEKGEISDALAFSVMEINTNTMIGNKTKEECYGDKDSFIREGKYDNTNYPISSYSYVSPKATLEISKPTGTKTSFTFEIDTQTNQIVCTSQQETTGGGSGNGTSNIPIETIADPGFYVEGDTTGAFNAWFDKDLSTSVDRYANTSVIVKWTGNLTGKQIYIKAGRDAPLTNEFDIYFVDSNGNKLNTYTCNYTSTQILNYGTDSVTYVPEGAVGISVFDISPYNFYEIQIFENGKYANNLISNIQKVGITANKIGFKWEQDPSVKSVKVYKDGQLLGQTSNKEFLITSYITASTKYDFYLEPVTDESEQTPNFKYEKTKFIIETLQGTAGLYVADVSPIEAKYYAPYIDSNTNTLLNRYSMDNIQIKWKGDITGKQIYVKAQRDAPLNNEFAINFIDSNGNNINTYTCNHNVVTNINYSQESVAYVPEGAVGMLVIDNNAHDFYEISLLEEGAYWDEHITNINATEIGKHSINLSWTKDASVQKTKVYQDGKYLGETDGTTYSVPKGLLTNMEYTFAFEPITAESTNGVRNKKEIKTFTTQSNGADFYLENCTSILSKKEYKNWFDADTSTYIDKSSSDWFVIKWTGDLTNKKIYVRANRDAPLYDSFVIKYVDASGNVLSTTDINGNSVGYLNYTVNSITNVPEGAVGLKLRDCNGTDFYDICLADEI